MGFTPSQSQPIFLQTFTLRKSKLDILKMSIFKNLQRFFFRILLLKNIMIFIEKMQTSYGFKLLFYIIRCILLLQFCSCKINIYII